MKLSKEEKESMYNGIMHEIYESFTQMLNESSDSKWNNYISSKKYAKDFLGNKGTVAVVVTDSMMNVADVFIYQSVDDDEYDVYTFKINLKNNKLKLLQIKITDEHKKEMQKYLKDVASIDGKVRDVYTSQEDIKSIFETFDEKPQKVLDALCELIGMNKDKHEYDKDPYEDYKKKEDSSKKEDVKKPGFERDEDGKLIGAGAKSAQEISEMLKDIAKDDKSFREVVKLFSAIKKLTEKTGGDYTRALMAVNSRLYAKKL